MERFHLYLRALHRIVMLRREVRRLKELRTLDQMYILELRRRLGRVPHDGGPE